MFAHRYGARENENWRKTALLGTTRATLRGLRVGPVDDCILKTLRIDGPCVIDQTDHDERAPATVRDIARDGTHAIEIAGLDVSVAGGRGVGEPSAQGTVDAGNRQRGHVLGHQRAAPGIAEQLAKMACTDAARAREARAV